MAAPVIHGLKKRDLAKKRKEKKRGSIEVHIILDWSSWPAAWLLQCDPHFEKCRSKTLPRYRNLLFGQCCLFACGFCLLSKFFL